MEEAQYGMGAAEMLADGVSCAVLLTSYIYTSAHTVARMCKHNHPLGASSRNSKSAVIRSKLCSCRTYTGPDGGRVYHTSLILQLLPQGSGCSS